jgi:SAM-dependent methyltransferase
LTINGLLHRISANPVIYDAIQIATGRPIIAAALRRRLARSRGLVVDVGGGTGQVKTLLPAGTRHVCIDVDPLKLAGYASKFPDAMPIVGDVMRLPLGTGSTPFLTFIAVSHHLDEEQFEAALRELARVQAPTGVLFFFDAVWAPDFRISRMLWKRDGGAYPRTVSRLVVSLRKHFRIVEQHEFSLWHRYLGCRCEPL